MLDQVSILVSLVLSCVLVPCVSPVYVWDVNGTGWCLSMCLVWFTEVSDTPTAHHSFSLLACGTLVAFGDVLGSRGELKIVPCLVSILLGDSDTAAKIRGLTDERRQEVGRSAQLHR